jgi:benzoyl-CoA reductase/2-hydroxyglutaryl-CoA dehydratase subunit BcrC/BadD/HgdB
MGYDEVLKNNGDIKERFLATPALGFRDGSKVSTDEIWDFLTVEGPRRYPNIFHQGERRGISDDIGLISSIKRHYFQITLFDRLNKAVKKGVPVVLIQGGQTHEPYYAAGAIPLRPGSVNGWATNAKENMTYEEADLRRLQIREVGRQELSVDACQTGKYEIIQNGLVPITMVAPNLALRCSDISFGVEAHRHGPIPVDLAAVDFPVNGQHHKAWAKRYAAENIRRLVNRISEKSGVKVTDEVLWAEIKLHNEKRRLAREFQELWWSADVPPTNSQDRGILGLGNESNGDPIAAKQILEESIAEVRERVTRGQRGLGLSENPVRLFVCGSCINPNVKLVDRDGGVVVGKDDGWSEVSVDVEESGDPYEELATAMLNWPYELPTQERAAWTVEQVRRSKSDGLLFMYQWGCNYQSGAARMVADIVKEKTGLPTMILERAMAERAEGHEQLHTRVEVFIEMLRSSKSSSSRHVGIPVSV